MSRDPFERMASNNPIDPAHVPPPPMDMASRIVGGRVAPPGWAIALAAAAAVVVFVGGGVFLFRGTEPGVPVASDSTSTSSTAATPTSLPAETTTSQASPPTSVPVEHGPAGEAVVYFLEDFSTLTPVARSLAVLSAPVTDEVRTTIEFLLIGPRDDEMLGIPSLSTAIPDGTRLLDLTVEGGMATIDLSAEFATGGGSFGEIARIEQVLYTLTRFDQIHGVHFRIEGAPVKVFGGHGIVLADPVVRTDVDTALPPILIESPARNAIGPNPLIVSGSANVFEATVSLALVDGDGLILWEGFTTASCGTGCRGDWEVAVPYQVDEPQLGALIAWEESAQDGSQINVQEHPVWLAPAGPVPELPSCSGSRVTGDLVVQEGLPAEVASLRTAIFEAAAVCDWAALEGLLGNGFSYSFGEPGDAIEYWQGLEAAGREPMRYLAELLNRPYGIQEAGDFKYHVWPSVATKEWSATSAEERDALRPLYDDDDFAAYEGFGGYIGFRVGIVDGVWLSFVEGD